jgi:hypothetical protein
MIETLACLITCVPIIAAALLGHRFGAERVVSFGGRIAFGWIAGILTALACFSAEWFQPFGLLTPILCGLVVAIAVRRLARSPLDAFANRITRRVRDLLPRRVFHAGGAALGAVAGTAFAASLWLGAALANGALPAQSSRGQLGQAPVAGNVASAVKTLLRTAHHGFVRHVPILGPLGDEVEALTLILNADSRVREQLARAAGLDRLAELPSLTAIFDDPATLGEVEGVRGGSLAAIYRLQRNPLILAFFEEPEVQKLILELRPSDLARRLEALEAEERSVTSR